MDIEERRRWMWAIKQQEWLHLLCDGRWIEMAQRNPMHWVKSLEYEVFLQVYGVRRGYAAKLLADYEGQEWFVARCEKAAQRLRPVSARHFPDRLDKERKKIQSESWKRLVYNKEVSYDDDERGFSSLTMKTLWFFLPNLIPMYDKQARLGLSRINGYSDNFMTSDNFISEFFSFCGDAKTTARNVMLSCGSTYRYPIRVVDKFLWLHGYGGRREYPGPTNAAIDRFMWKSIRTPRSK